MASSQRLLKSGAILAAIALAAAIVVAGLRDGNERSEPSIAGRYTLPAMTTIVELCSDFELDSGIARLPAMTVESIDPGILAPTRSADRFALRVAPEQYTCPSATATPEP